METYSDLTKRFVPYYRVSSKRQGESGLGLAAQKSIIEGFFSERELDDYEFVEIKSAKTIKDRPSLREAVKYCKENNKILTVAVSDRMSRRVEDGIWLLNELDGWMHACDISGTKGVQMKKYDWVNKINFAELENRIRSIRVKDALKHSKKPKGRAACKPFSEHKNKMIGLKVSMSHRENFQNNVEYQKTLNYIEMREKELRENGGKKYSNPKTGEISMFQVIADELNEFGFERARKTPEGRPAHTEYSTRKAFYDKCRKKQEVQFHDFSKESRLRKRRKLDEEDFEDIERERRAS